MSGHWQLGSCSDHGWLFVILQNLLLPQDDLLRLESNTLKKQMIFCLWDTVSFHLWSICFGQFSIQPFLRAPAIASMPRLGPNLFKAIIHFIAKTFHEIWIQLICAWRTKPINTQVCYQNYPLYSEDKTDISHQHIYKRKNSEIEMSHLDGKYVESI